MVVWACSSLGLSSREMYQWRIQEDQAQIDHAYISYTMLTYQKHHAPTHMANNSIVSVASLLKCMDDINTIGI